MAHDAELEVHKAWLGLVQPVGLVVSPALLDAQAVPEKNAVALQARFAEVSTPLLTNFVAFATRFLDWRLSDLVGATEELPLPEELTFILPEYHETLAPSYAAIDPGDGIPQMLITQLPPGLDLDAVPEDDKGWAASPAAKFERLLRGCGTHTGILCNGQELRLVYAPKGETSGHLSFGIEDMLQINGRPMLAALHMLLSEWRVFSAPDGRRLRDILTQSRRYQSEVSTKLAGQVLGALWDLLRGFQAADEAVGGTLLQVPHRDVYGGLLTTLLRLVFLLYAEGQGLISKDEVYVQHYSVEGLYERLRADAGQHPDTMDQRYGAWSGLLSLFRLVYDGGGHGDLHLPGRHGQLFDPKTYPFLEGGAEVPRVSDGCLYRVLDALLVLEGERLSYRALDVEQIGSVYEAMMGFAIERAEGSSIAVHAGGQKGSVPADMVVDVERLLAQPREKRKKWLQELTGCDLPPKAASALADAETSEGAVAALGRKVSRYTPSLIARGALYLQPTEERRRSGSHYTPRELTQPIVETTLRPVLEALGEHPLPDQILALKVCDPAMGSGAFLVEACRQLADRLLAAWEFHASEPDMPDDEEPLLHAKRMIAERCLYGVDKNPFAVSLAKLSLWLVTLAKDHAFTFVDHALKQGDSVVGLTREQIACFDWRLVDRGAALPLFDTVEDAWHEAHGQRDALVGLAEDDEAGKQALLHEAELALADVRLVGDLVINAFFSGEKEKEREARRLVLRQKVDAWRQGRGDRTELEAVVAEMRAGLLGVTPFHWEEEFPEVFDRERPGFDSVVGNPPFLGGRKISTTLGLPYFDFLKENTPGAGNVCDLVAYFFRMAFSLLRDHGTFGLIATNTISQGDTREGGLAWIRQNCGTIYSAVTRTVWPGAASVVVSLVWVMRGRLNVPLNLNGRVVKDITAYLFHQGPDDNPASLAGLSALYSQGSKIYGQGFVFDDGDADANPLDLMRKVLASQPSLSSRVHPYIGGSEVNDDPLHRHSRFVINFSDLLSENDLEPFGPLAAIVREKVKPVRDALGNNPVNLPLKRRWWAYQAHRPDFYSQIASLSRILVLSKVTTHFGLTFLPTGLVYSEKLILFALSDFSAFCVLQSRVYEVWARFFSATLGDALQYSPSDSFQTFPLLKYHSENALSQRGQEYFETRSAIMARSGKGLTDTYNAFCSPDERSPDILVLREMHEAMDRTVLDAYGWNDIPSECGFFLEYEINEEEWGSKKKPWRYRWPDEVHDEVLARLLDLNQKRAQEEALAGATAAPKPRKARSKKQAATETPLLPV